MRGEDIFDMMEYVDPAFVEAADEAVPKLKRRVWPGWVAAAACLCLVLTGGALAVEAHAYNEAVQFFDAYGLSTEGLTRGEIKEVYRDITTESFSNSKTAEVIQTNATVQGVEIAQEAPSPQELEALWNLVLDSRSSGVHYKSYSEEKLDETLGFDVLDKSVFEKYDGEKLLWSVSFQGLYLDDWAAVPGGTVVWGYTPTWSSEQTQTAWLAAIDGGGTVLWQKGLLHGFQWEHIASVLDNEDGTYAVFSRGDLEHLVLSQFDSAGAELCTRSTEVGNQGIWNAARLGEDYIVQLGSMSQSRIVKVSRSGELTDAFNYYTAEDCDYCVTDMAEFGGRLYLSTHAVPRLEEGGRDAGGRYEVQEVLDQIFEKDKWEIDGEELVELLRENYTAVLLVCDPGSGAAQTFYSVPGCLGGKLSVGETLSWDVESFTSAEFSPATSAYSIRGTCQVYRYSFDESGELLNQEKTDEVTPYWR